MKTPKKNFSYVIQVAIAVVKSGPNAQGISWFRNELQAWFLQCFDLECLKRQD